MNMVSWIIAFDVLLLTTLILFAREIKNKRSTSSIKADRRGITALITATVLLFLIIIAKPFPGRIASIVLNSLTLFIMLATLIVLIRDNRRKTIMDEESATYFGCTVIIGLFLYYISLILRVIYLYLPATIPLWIS